MCACPEFDDCNCLPSPCTDCLEPDTIVIRHVANPSACDGLDEIIREYVISGPGCKLSFGTPITQDGTITLVADNSNGVLQFSADGTLWQDSPTFINQSAGRKKYFIREAANQTCLAAGFIVVAGCVTPAPTVVTPVNYTLNANAQPLSATGTGLLWYTTPNGGTGSSVTPIPLTNTVGVRSYYVSQTINGCEGPRAVIQVEVASSGCVPGPTVDVNPQVTQCIGGFVNIKTTDGCSFGFRSTTTTCGEQICTLPTGPQSISTVASTCNQAGQYLNNGHFEYGPVSNADRYALWNVNGGQTRPNYGEGTAIPSDGLIEVTGIPGNVELTSYQLIIFNGSTDCFIQKVANFASVTCNPSCIQPSFVFGKTDATCNGGATLSNGILRLTSIVNANKFQLCEGLTFQCPSDYDAATTFSGGGPVVMASNIGFTALEEYKDFNVRLFNNSANCFATQALRFYNQCYQAPCISPTHGTLVVTKATCANSSGAINNNATISIPGVNSATKYGFSTGTVYSGPDFSTAYGIAGNTITLANLTGSANDTNYVIRIFNGRNNCFLDVPVVVPGMNCVVACDTPAFTITSTPPTCTDGNAASNGTVSITGITNGTKYQICLDSTFSCTPNFVGSPAITGSGPIVVFNTLGFDSTEAYKDFTVRVYNGSETCFNTHTLRINNPCFVCCGMSISSITLTNS